MDLWQALEWGAAALGAVSVFLLARLRGAGWWVGAVSVALYGVILYRAGLFADSLLQGVYLITSGVGAWGWYRAWRAAAPGSTDIPPAPPVTWAGQAERALLALFAVAGALAGGAYLSGVTGAAAPWVDAGLASGSLAGQYLLMRRRIDNWLVWIAVDVGYVALYVQQGLYPTAGLYTLFLALATMGYLEWRRAGTAHVGG